MGYALRLDELVWDEWNEEHIARHGVDPEEVEQAVFDPSAMFLRTRGEDPRYLVLGLTDAGRYLFVVVESMGRARGYAITARDMTDGEKRRFKARGK